MKNNVYVGQVVRWIGVWVDGHAPRGRVFETPKLSGYGADLGARIKWKNCAGETITMAPGQFEIEVQ